MLRAKQGIIRNAPTSPALDSNHPLPHPFDEQFRTSAASVFAAGDVLGPTLASIAMEQGRAAACHAMAIPFAGTVDPTPASAVYGMPEVAGVGLTEEQCQAQGIDYAVGRSEFDLIPRGAIAGHGSLLKLIFKKDNQN